ncbi:MAG: AraC family transcriptional regulator [Sphingobium sp.]|nr:AraC family transcriptional regulator [Sphingobium sp.]
MADLPKHLRFQLTDLPVENRRAALHDILGPALNMSFSPTADDVDIAADVYMLPHMWMMYTRTSPTKVDRVVSEAETDHFELVWDKAPSRMRVAHLGREIETANGTALLTSMSDSFQSEVLSASKPVVLRISRATLLAKAPDAEEALMRPISPDLPAMQMLDSYMEFLRDQSRPLDPALEQVVADHLCHLVALTLASSRGKIGSVDGESVRAARFATIARWIAKHMTDPGLSISDVAATHKISERYAQLLFAERGTTFSRYLLAERLSLAQYRLSTSPALQSSIADLAFACGFGDLSYFNRAFRKTYGETPSDVRNRATIGRQISSQFS